ncbi:MAG: hypothetical protein ACTSXX_14975 [Candidatus Baldrarchaeia archaeon]
MWKVTETTRKELRLVRLLKRALEDFEKQFGVKLEHTGNECRGPREAAVKFKIHELLSSKQLDNEVTGWFYARYEDDEKVSVWCEITINLQHSKMRPAGLTTSLGEPVLLSKYKNGKWSKPEWSYSRS